MINEALLGEIPVSTRLALGSERLRLIFTSTRIVVDHVGKRGTGAMAGFSIFGAISSALEDLFKTGRETAVRRSVRKMSPAQILKAHPDNFAINYGEVVQVTLVRTPRLSTNITILTGDEKLELSTNAKFDTVRGLFTDQLGDRTTVHST